MLSQARPSGPVRPATFASCAIHQSASAGSSRIRRRSLLRPLQMAERAVSRVARDAEVEGLLLPPVEDVRLADPRIGERQHRTAARPAAAVHRPHALDAARLVGAQPDHGVRALEAQPIAGIGLYTVALQKAGAEPDPLVRHESLAFDQPGIGLAVPGRGGVIDDPGAVRRVPVVLDPGDGDVPGPRAGVDEVQRLRSFQSRVREHHGDVFRQPAAAGIDDVLEHVGRGAAAREADDGGARDEIGAAGRAAAERRGAGHASRPSWSVSRIAGVTLTNNGWMPYSVSPPSRPGG